MDWSADESAVRPWSVQAVIEALDRIGPIELGEVFREMQSEAGPLCAALREALHKQGSRRARVTAAALLLMLNDAEGREPFLAALSEPDGEARTLAFEFFQYQLSPRDLDLGWRGFRAQCPLTSGEVYNALKDALHPPWTGLRAKILRTLYWHDFPQVRSLTRMLLSHPDEELRRDIAESYLREGRDEGAFGVLEAMLRGAPAYVDYRRDRGNFHIIKMIWYSIEAAALRGPPELRLKAGALALEFVSKALAAPDAASRLDINDGLIDVNNAIKVIAAVMPDGSKDVLERMITSDVLDEHYRGLALSAYGRAIGKEARPVIMAALDDPELRAAAASALGQIAKGKNGAQDIAALVAVLANEARPGVVSAIARALLDLGPAGKPAVEAVLERSSPWAKMELAWQIEGGTDRQFADLLTEAGVMDPITDEELAEALEQGFDLRSLVYAGGNRLVVFNVKSSTGIEHVALFDDLVKAARPVIRVDDLKETNSGVSTISFSYQGQAFSFNARAQGRWHDVPAVMKGFDYFMRAIGRDDRCYELEGGGEHAIMVVAPASKFEPLVSRLRIPVERDSESARDSAKAYQHQIQNMKF